MGWIPARLYVGQFQLRLIGEGALIQNFELLPRVRDTYLLMWLATGQLQARGEFHPKDEPGTYYELQPIPTEEWEELFRIGADGWPEALHWDFNFVTVEEGDWAELEILGDIDLSQPIGRPEKFPWADFDAEAVRQLEYEGGLHLGFRQADLERAMAEWCSTTWGEEPASSTIRARIGKIRKEFEAGRR